MEEEKNNQLFSVISDSILREEPSLTSIILTVVSPKAKLEYMNESKEDSNGEKYNKMKLIKSSNFPKEITGWILYKQLNIYIPSLSIETKNKLLKTIYHYLSLNTAYSMEFPQRNGGYFETLYDNKYYFDCSSFISTILNRVFNNFPPPEPKGENGEIIVWATIHYFENINKENKENSLFYIIQRINKEKEKLNLDNLEIGDIIIGRAKKLTSGINHIMIYIGEGYIAHCTRGNFLGKKENEYRDGVVKEKLTDNYYTEIEAQENIEKGNITKRFDDEICVIRYKEN